MGSYEALVASMYIGSSYWWFILPVCFAIFAIYAMVEMEDSFGFIVFMLGGFATVISIVVILAIPSENADTDAQVYIKENAEWCQITNTSQDLQGRTLSVLIECPTVGKVQNKFSGEARLANGAYLQCVGFDEKPACLAQLWRERPDL